jgi:hypothetical protein
MGSLGWMPNSDGVLFRNGVGGSNPSCGAIKINVLSHIDLTAASQNAHLRSAREAQCLPPVQGFPESLRGILAGLL